VTFPDGRSTVASLGTCRAHELAGVLLAGGDPDVGCRAQGERIPAEDLEWDVTEGAELLSGVAETAELETADETDEPGDATLDSVPWP
jgi:hypothetical protein